jgi:hypothetical protein
MEQSMNIENIKNILIDKTCETCIYTIFSKEQNIYMCILPALDNPNVDLSPKNYKKIELTDFCQDWNSSK